MTNTTARWIVPILCLVGLALAVTGYSRQALPREIRLEARGMAFYLEGGSIPNPVLQVRTGQRIKLVLINLDSGMLHDWAVDRMGVHTKLLPGDGSSGSIEFRIPDNAGTYEYDCSLHDRLMRGLIEVSD